MSRPEQVRHIVVSAHGGPEALVPTDLPVGDPGPGELRLRQTAIGVNFHDVYVRSGLYRMLSLPGLPGIEAGGVVEAAGEGCDPFKTGDRLGYVTPAYGAYSAARLLPVEAAIRLPDTLDDIQAASVLLKGMTAVMLARSVHTIRRGGWVLIHAAAGGVGLLLRRCARWLGALIIGTVGDARKAQAAQVAGAEHVILYCKEDFVSRVHAITEGEGVSVVYDSVGRDTFEGSLACLAYHGHLVNFGQSSGPIASISPDRLARRSNTLSRPMVFHHLRDAASREQLSAQLFKALGAGILEAETAAVIPLDQAARAHTLLESRSVSGSVILKP